MRLVNRFVDLAATYSDGNIPLDVIFSDASIDEQEQIIEAMYVISDRRIATGRPIGIQEFSDSIPDLVVDQEIMDAAVEISLQGLVASGLSPVEANAAISEFDLIKPTDLPIGSTKVVDSKISTEPRERNISSIHIDLPTDFGNLGLDGKPRYELRRIIGSGNQGTMYEAIDRVFAEDGESSYVALKVYHDEGTIRGQQEGSRARRIRHKNIARVYDLGRSLNGESYVTYELIAGQSLDYWLKHRRTPLNAEQACRLAISLARGVQCAHNSGVIHRDIKPSNVLINRDGEPILTDFGIAFSSSTDPRLSYQYGTRGSLAFMAPEQYDGSSDGVMPSVDIYGLGGLLYWMLCDHYPNGDTVEDAIAYLELRTTCVQNRVHEWAIDWRLQAIVLKSINVDQGSRYLSAEALALDLEDYIEKKPIPWLDQSAQNRIHLFARRNPLLLSLNFIVFLAIIGSMWIWLASKSEIAIEQAKLEADLHIERLNTQVAFEQERIEQVKEKSKLLKVVIETWNEVINASEDEGQTISNLLFLYTVSTNGFLDDDPELADKVLNHRIEVGEEYLASIDTQALPIVHLALWHEMLGEWYKDKDELKSKAHLSQASHLAEKIAPEDTLWQQRLRSH